MAQPDELFDILPRVRGEWESFLRGRGAELYRIREYMPEDSARHVDWKATAKSGSLKVREFFFLQETIEYWLANSRS